MANGGDGVTIYAGLNSLTTTEDLGQETRCGWEPPKVADAVGPADLPETCHHTASLGPTAMRRTSISRIGPAVIGNIFSHAECT